MSTASTDSLTTHSYCFSDPRVVLIPIEHLSPAGIDSPFARLLQHQAGWDTERIALFNQAFALYWERTQALAARTRTWRPPRIRHVAVVVEPLGVRPYAQLLNTSAWTVYESDLDPRRSSAEFAAYVLVHGDWMARTGEVTQAAVRSAAYWLERSNEECQSFADAAERSERPDAVAFRAVAQATSWLRQLCHRTLRPPTAPAHTYRPIPGAELLVPRKLEASPPALVDAWTKAANKAVAEFRTAWSKVDRAASHELCEWLVNDEPPLLVAGRNGRVLWDPETPKRVGTLRQELRLAGGAAVGDIAADLAVVAAHTRRFLAALADASALPAPHAEIAQEGYSYLHRERRLIAYNLHEQGVERLQTPALPYARLMLGARTVHEWAHLAVDAGWVPQADPPRRVADLCAALAAEFDACIIEAPAGIRGQTQNDLEELMAWAGQQPPTCGGDPRLASPGGALVCLLLTRMPDYQANLLGTRFMSAAEQETYIRHNIRTLWPEYPPPRLWRMLVRYLTEYQYLRFSIVADPRRYFLSSTWFDADFIVPGIVDDRRFDALVDAVARICSTYAVDERWFRVAA
jgi:hypothetical protein